MIYSHVQERLFAGIAHDQAADTLADPTKKRRISLLGHPLCEGEHEERMLLIDSNQ